MSKNYWEQNIKIIEERDELLYAELEKYDLSFFNTELVQVEEVRDGSQIVKIEKEDYEWYFQSRYEAKKVASKWVDNLGKIEVIATIIIYGLGNGQILKELLKRTGENVIIIVYEPSIELFIKVMNEIDFSFLESRVFTVIEGINDNYFEGLFEAFVTYENMSVCKFVGHPNYWSFYQDDAMNYLGRLQSMIKQLDIICHTKLALCEGYYKNVLMNLKHLDKVSVLDQLRNKVGVDIPSDLPAIIVSAGPSLSKNVEQLKKAKGKAFIIATDSALRGMMDAGVMPDAFVTIDPLKPLNRFEDERICNIPLFCTESGRYEIVDKVRDKIIYANNSFGFGEPFFKSLEKDYLVSEYGGSVATFSYAIARIMGFKTIIMVGQDLAFTDNNRYYNSAKEWNDHERLAPNAIVEVEDIHGNMVPTSKDMEVYLEWFEAQILHGTDIETIDATEGGAKIKGSKIIDLATAIEQKCKLEYDMVEYLRNLPSYASEEEKNIFKDFAKEIPSIYEALYEDAKAGVKYYEKLIGMIRSNPENNSELTELTRKISEVMQRIENSMVYFHIQHKLEKIEYTILNNLGVSLDDQVEDAIQIAGRGKAILDSLVVILEEEVLEEVKSVFAEFE